MHLHKLLKNIYVIRKYAALILQSHIVVNDVFFIGRHMHMRVSFLAT